MRPWWQCVASIVAVLALVGTPSVVAACALLCLPGVEHHAEATAPTSAPAAVLHADAHADCHGHQSAMASGTTDANTTAVTEEPQTDAGVVRAAADHTCCPDTLGLPAVASSNGRGSANHLTLVAVSWVALRGGQVAVPAHTLARHPVSLPRLPLASAPLVLRI